MKDKETLSLQVKIGKEQYDLKTIEKYHLNNLLENGLYWNSYSLKSSKGNKWLTTKFGGKYILWEQSHKKAIQIEENYLSDPTLNINAKYSGSTNITCENERGGIKIFHAMIIYSNKDEEHQIIMDFFRGIEKRRYFFGKEIDIHHGQNVFS